MVLQVRPDVEGQEALGQAGRAYLEAIYELQQRSGKATTSSVAARLGLADPSATRMIKKLAALQLLERTPYHGARLTPAGETLARQTTRRRAMVERFLVEVLGYRYAQAQAEADRLAYVISEEFERRIAALIRHPGVDSPADAAEDC